MSLAPILISVYTRKEHLQKSIEALSKNHLANKSDLFVVSDGAAKKEDIQLIEQIREYIVSIGGFKSVTLIKREKNYGSYKSIKEAIDDIISRYNRIIFLEDDIITSEFFLSYVNSGLDFYEEKSEVFSVCAYSFPIRFPSFYKHEIYFWSRFNAWGFGTWKNKWEQVDFNLTKINNFLDDKKKLKEFYNIAPSTRAIIDNLIRKGQKPIDTIISIHNFDENKVCVYPINALTYNIGFDGSGENCMVTTKYKPKFQNTNNIISHRFLHNIKTNCTINQKLKKFCTPSQNKSRLPSLSRLYVFFGTRFKELINI